MSSPDESPWLVAVDGGVVLVVRAQPGAARTRVAGLHGAALKIAVRARPIDGAANRELVAFLAEVLDVRPARVSVVSGAHGRAKRVRVDGLDAATVAARLAPFVDKAPRAD